LVVATRSPPNFWHITQMAISRKKKLEWFSRGATALERVCPGLWPEPTYLCPICMDPFSIRSVEDGALTAEHVPPKALGGRELVLTCKSCNNEAGTKLDADAFTKERIRAAMAGKGETVERVRATIGSLRVQGEVRVGDGQFTLHVPKHLNRPGASADLRAAARVGMRMAVQYEPFAELGARISWFRAGYLALFALSGYLLPLDPAFQIVRKQITNFAVRHIVTFTSEPSQEFPDTDKRIFKVLTPEWHRGWAVQFGRHFVHFPSAGDMDFYERLSSCGSSTEPYVTRYEYVGWPIEPTFGLAAN
jgi:hypothetical protein